MVHASCDVARDGKLPEEHMSACHALGSCGMKIGCGPSSRKVLLLDRRVRVQLHQCVVSSACALPGRR